jgi:hypothetical protein
MRSLSLNLTQFLLRFLAIAGITIFAGYLRWGSLIFVSTTMSFQFTQNGLTAGLSYALFKHTSVMKSFLVLFCWMLIFTALEAFSNRWMYVLNLTYIAGISSVMYLYLYLIKKSVLQRATLRVGALTLAIGIVNTLHVIILMLVSWKGSRAENPQFITHVLNTCWFNFQTGIIIGLAAGIGIESVDHSMIPRAQAALRSWALGANGN